MDSFIKGMRSAGSSSAEGVFTLDRRLIRERFLSFQEEEPAFFLLRLLQGLVGLEPEQITVSLRVSQLLLEAHKPRKQLNWKEPDTFLSGEDALSQGLLTSYLKPPQKLTLEQQGHESGSALVILNDGQPGFGSTPAGENRVRINLVLAKPKNKLQAWMYQPHDFADYHRAVSRRMRFCSVPIHLDGRLINQAGLPRAHEPYLAQSMVFDANCPQSESIWSRIGPNRRTLHLGGSDWKVDPRARRFRHETNVVSFRDTDGLDVDGERNWSTFFVGLSSKLEPEARLIYIDRGLELKTVTRSLGLPGLVAVAYARGLDTDAGGMAVVENNAFLRQLDQFEPLARALCKDYLTIKSAERGNKSAERGNAEIFDPRDPKRLESYRNPSS